MKINLQVTAADGVTREVPTICRIDTEDEINYYRHGGILHFVLRNLAAGGSA
jgi:aconitate hydratase